MTRSSKFVILMSAGMVWALPAMAGFEFTPPVVEQAPPQIQEVTQPADAPIALVPEVTAEALSTQSEAKAEEVYIKRQKSQEIIAPGDNEAINTSALLKATTKDEPVALAPEKEQSNALVINPYPLDEQATHASSGKVPLEQAMMEEGGSLRPVAVPGTANVSGRNVRAQIISRRDNSADYAPLPNRAPLRMPPQGALSLTPIPGGEGEPLKKIEATTLAPLPLPLPVPALTKPSATNVMAARVSPMPKPALPEGHLAPVSPQAASTEEGFTEAVGFGRDLPLALAMSQVIPAEYSYSFAKGVDVGATVSWQGGKPWNIVLDEMLAASQLKAVIKDNQVMIVPGNAQS